MLMHSIIDYRKDENALPKDDKYVVVNGKQKMKDGNSTSNPGSTSCEPLKGEGGKSGRDS
jgi:hypothetical protein